MRDALWEVLPLAAVKPFGLVAFLALCAAGLSSLALVVAALFARRGGATRATRALAVITFGTFALGAFAASRVIAAAHEAILEPAPPASLGKIHWVWGKAVEETHAAWLGLGLALVLVAAASGAALALLARRAGGSRPFVLAAALACLLGLVTGVGLVHRTGQPVWVCGGQFDKAECFPVVIKEAVEESSRVRLVIVALAALGSGLLVALSRRNTKEVFARDPEAALPLGAAVFAFGLAAWSGARGMAYDARHPLPNLRDEGGTCPDWMAPPPSRLPAAGRCDANADMPQVIVDADGLRLDGVRATNVEALTSLLKSKRELYRRIQQKDLVDPLVMITAPADTPVATLLPVVSAVANGFRGTVAILGAHPERSVSTATLGEVTLHRRCCNTRLRIDPNGAPLSSHATWGDVARAASEGAFFRLDP